MSEQEIYRCPHCGRKVVQYEISSGERESMTDYGPNPVVLPIEELTDQNNTFRTSIWTGTYLQVTVMSLMPGEDIGLEQHPNVDQFLRIEEGRGLVMMGDQRNQMNFSQMVNDDDTIIIPAGKWHNLINQGDEPLKLYSIYSPPNHPYNTIHETKADAEAAEGNH